MMLQLNSCTVAIACSIIHAAVSEPGLKSPGHVDLQQVSYRWVNLFPHQKDTIKAWIAIKLWNNAALFTPPG